MSFDQWVRYVDKSLLLQTHAISQCQRGIDVVIQLEHLQDEFSRLPFVTANMDFPHLQESTNDEVTISPETEEWLRVELADDFTYLNYT